MRCQKANCGGETSVVDSRLELTSNAVYRRRECDRCNDKWTTIETRTAKSWMLRKFCNEKGCTEGRMAGHTFCQPHMAQRWKHKRIKAESSLETRARFCKTHPDRPATNQTRTLRCHECWRKYRVELTGANRRRKTTDTGTTTRGDV